MCVYQNKTDDSYSTFRCSKLNEFINFKLRKITKMRLTDQLSKMKSTFVPIYGRNRSRKVGRSLLREEEVIPFDKKSLITKDYIQKSYTRQEGKKRFNDIFLSLLIILNSNKF